MVVHRNPELVSADQRGVILIIGAVALMGVFVIAGLIIDFGMWFVARNELQNVTDAAAFAGGRALGALYAGGTVDDGTTPSNLPRRLYQNQQNFSLSSTEVTFISDVINASAIQHQAGGVPITIAPNDITIGSWDLTTNQFTATGLGTLRPNAVQVVARRDSTSNTPLTTLFGQLLNINTLSVTAIATSALSPLNRVPPNNPPVTLPPGEIEFPMGIDQSFGNFCNLPCNDPTNFGLFCVTLTLATPPNTCTAWNTFDGPIGDIGGITNTTITSPQTSTGDSYNFWGDSTAQRGNLVTLYGNLGGSTPGSVPYRETLLPVYAANGCVPPTGGPIPIVGFINARIVAAGGAATGQFLLKFACDVVSTGRSGGQQDFGTWGSIPVLVE